MKYTVEFNLEVGGYMTVEASSEEEARAIVYDEIEQNDLDNVLKLDGDVTHREFFTQSAEQVAA
jgi:hypothetical protein